MTVIKSTPTSLQVYEAWQRLSTQMCFLLPHTPYHGTEAEFLLYSLQVLEEQLKYYTHSNCKPCRHCGRPTNTFLLCSAKEFKESCEPTDEVYSFEDYCRDVDSRPDYSPARTTSVKTTISE